MDGEMFIGSLLSGIVVLLSSTLVARMIGFAKCAWPQQEHLLLCSLARWLTLRPAIEAAVEVAKKATVGAAVAVGAASASAGIDADAPVSAPSVPRPMKRRHARERDKRERALRRSNSYMSSNTNTNTGFNGKRPADSAVTIVIRVSKALAAAATVAAQPQSPTAAGSSDENDDHEACSKANICLPQKHNTDDQNEAGAQASVFCYINYFFGDSSHNLSPALYKKPIEDVKQPSTPDIAHKSVAQPLPNEEPTCPGSTAVAPSRSIEEHDRDKGLAGTRPQGLLAGYVTGILGFGGGVAVTSSQSQWSMGGVSKGSSSRSNVNKKGSDKRKRDQRDGDDGNEDRKRGGHGGHHRHFDDDEDWDGRYLACPFYKLDPRFYSRCSTKYELKRFADVKQHLLRCHKVKEYYCSRCFMEFEDHTLWELHTQTCNETNHGSGPENFTADEIRRLGNAPRGATNEAKYYWVWDHFFSRHPRPDSPYVQEYLSETRDLHRPDFEAGLRAALASPHLDIERREGEDRAAWADRAYHHLSPQMSQYASQTAHPRRFRYPPSVVVVAPHVLAQEAGGSPPQPQTQQPLGHVPTPLPAASSSGLLGPVARQLQVPQSPLPPNPQLPQQQPPPRRLQGLPGAVRSSSAVTPSPSSPARAAMLNYYRPNPHLQHRPSQPQYGPRPQHGPQPRSQRPLPPHPSAQQGDIPIDPNLFHYTPPPPAQQQQPTNVTPPGHQGPSANPTPQPADGLDIPDYIPNDEFNQFISEWFKNNPWG